MFKNISSPSREKLAETFHVFRTVYQRPQARAKAIHNFQSLVFNANAANQKSIDLLQELQKLTKDAFGECVRFWTKTFTSWGFEFKNFQIVRSWENCTQKSRFVVYYFKKTTDFLIFVLPRKAWFSIRIFTMR